MHYRLVLYSLGNILLLLALIMMFPLIVALFYNSPDVSSFAYSFLITLLVSIGLRQLKSEGNYGHREGYLIVAVGWALFSLFAALPYYLSNAVPSFVDAYFEAMSAFTTTGATIVIDIEALTPPILFWRSFCQWLGGMGFILLSLAVFSIFGSGASMFRAEVPSVTPEKIMPKLKHTAITFWLIYTGITVLEVIALNVAGMSFFESLIHSFSTMSTGGFSSRSINIEAFQNPAFEVILMVFMLIAGVNFSLYYRMYRKKSLFPILKDSEFKGYLLILGIAAGVIAASLYCNMHLDWLTAVRQSLFQTISICTTTGFSSTDFTHWPSLAQAVLFILMFIGGCSGSTGGAIKVARVIILLKYMKKQIYRASRPRMMIQLKVGEALVPDAVVHEILAFFFIYMMLFLFGGMVVAATGVDLVTSFSAAAATLGNIGPGLALVGPLENFAFLHPIAKWVLSFLMMAGRLEVMTALVIFSPDFWRR